MPTSSNLNKAFESADGRPPLSSISGAGPGSPSADSSFRPSPFGSAFDGPGWLQLPRGLIGLCHQLQIPWQHTAALLVLLDEKQHSPGIIWMSAATMAQRLYGAADKSTIREARRVLAYLVKNGILSVAAAPNRHRATRYDVTPFLKMLAALKTEATQTQEKEAA